MLIWQVKHLSIYEIKEFTRRNFYNPRKKYWNAVEENIERKMFELNDFSLN